MNENSNWRNDRLQPGRFVIRLAGQTQTGLAAHQVLVLLKTPEGRDAEIFRIHRVFEDGKMELVGVSPGQFKQQNCLLIRKSDVRAARLDFDAIRDAAVRNAPPCRIELQLGHMKSADPPHFVAMIFPNVCSDAVAAWKRALGRDVDDPIDADADALASMQSNDVQVVLRKVLQPVE